jgi:hypothetical protein
MKRLELPVLFISKQGKLIWENAKSVELKLKEYLQEISYEVLKTSKKVVLLEKTQKNFIIN